VIRRSNNARKVTIDGIEFGSKGEAGHYVELKLRQAARQISELKVHPVYELVVNGVRVGKFTPDFSYIENGKRIVDEFKGRVYRDFPLRWALAKALYPDVEFRLIKSRR